MCGVYRDWKGQELLRTSTFVSYSVLVMRDPDTQVGRGKKTKFHLPVDLTEYRSDPTLLLYRPHLIVHT